jgi:hypothetical protein
LAPDFELGNFYHVLNSYGLFTRYGIDVQETRGADVFRLYRPALPGHRRDVTVDGPELGGHPAIDVMVLADDGGATWLFAVNQHPTDAAEIALGGLNGSAEDVLMMAAESPTGEMAFAEPPVVESGRVTVPPLSILRARFR